MKTIVVTLVLFFLTFSLSYSDTVGASDRDSVASISVALALSGGGARGLAGVGVLKAFEERKIKIRAIAGTSIGGIIGGLYSCGYSADQIRTIIKDIDFSRLFTNTPPRASMLFTQRRERERHLISVRFDGFTPQIPHALTGGQELTSLLTELTLAANYRAGGDFAKLNIPFKTVCTDIVFGREVVLDTGSLADAMRASMAFPLAFTGMEQGDQVLMDGGMLTPIPVALARTMCIDSPCVVAVNTTSPLLPKSGLTTPVAIANQVTSVMSANALATQLNLADFVITPNLTDISSTNFEIRDSIIALGYRAGLAAADTICAHWRVSSLQHSRNDNDSGVYSSNAHFIVKGVSLFPADSVDRWLSPRSDSTGRLSLRRRLDVLIERYRKAGYDLAVAHSITLDSAGTATITIDEGLVHRIDILNDGITRDWVIRSYFPLRRGEPITVARAMRGMREIYGTDLCDRVTLHIVPEEGGARIIIGVKERKPTQARLGWHWDDHFQSEEFVELLNDNVFGLGVEYLAHAGYGLDRQAFYGELRANRIFSTYLTGQIRFGYGHIDRTTYDTIGNPFGIREESKFGFIINVGQQIARLGAVTAGFSFDRVRYDSGVLPIEKFSLNSLNLESTVETFDRVTFPMSGKRHAMQVRFSQKYLGSGNSYTRFVSTLEAYYTFARNYTYHPKITIGLSNVGLPASERFYLGGMKSLYGYRGEGLNGDKCLLLNQEFRVRLPLWLYASARLDIGEVYNHFDQLKFNNLRQGIGGSLALDTPIGPFELAYGRTSKGVERWYFSAGFEF